VAPAGGPPVLQGAPGEGDAGQVLAAFGRALGQEAHVLVSRPELAWQQLHNRLQWVEGPVAERVAAAMRAAYAERGHASDVRVGAVDRAGARVVEDTEER